MQLYESILYVFVAFIFSAFYIAFVDGVLKRNQTETKFNKIILATTIYTLICFVYAINYLMTVDNAYNHIKNNLDAYNELLWKKYGNSVDDNYKRFQYGLDYLLIEEINNNVSEEDRVDFIIKNRVP